MMGLLLANKAAPLKPILTPSPIIFMKHPGLRASLLMKQ